MSRIFDALQRSGTEQSGVEYPDMMSVATAVFEAPRIQDVPKLPIEPQPEQIEEISVPDSSPETEIPESAPPIEGGGSIEAFPSLEVSITPESRLVFFTQPESLAAEKFR